MARESPADKTAFEQRPGGSRGPVLAAIEGKDMAAGAASAKAPGPSMLVSGSELVRAE